jgi:hypothetical protein
MKKALVTTLLAWTISMRALAELVPLPDISLKASPDGQAQFNVSGGFRWSLDSKWDASLRATYKVTTNSGIASLLSLSSGDLSATRPWEAGLTASLYLGTIPDNGDALQATRNKAVDACAIGCGIAGDDSPHPFCDFLIAKAETRAAGWIKAKAIQMNKEDFCPDEQKAVASAQDPDLAAVKEKALKACLKPCWGSQVRSKEQAAYCANPRFADRDTSPFPASEIPRKKLCEAGQRVMDDWQNKRPDLIKHPRLLINVGARAGETAFSYLAGDTTHLQKTSLNQATVTSGASGILLVGASDATMTLEGFGAFQRTASASGASAQYCQPAGAVDTPKGNVPAQSCSTLPVGAPAITNALNAGVYLGWLNQIDDWWRIAAGVQFALPKGGTKRVELSFPATFALSSTALDYKGALRIGPAIVWNTPPGQPTVISYGVTLEVLGQRTLFSQEFDKL